MAHFALLWKARTIEKYRQKYEDEKIHSIIISNASIQNKTLFQRWKHYRHDMHDRLSRTFSKWYPEGTTVSNFFVNLRTDMKLASILLRSLYGFVGGLLLTYLGFMFFVFQLSLSLMHATILSSVLGVVLTLGLTFSNRMRCIIFLLIPQLFSRVGRYTLTCYALVLILTGPATNTLKNSEVLSESMACRQEYIKLNVRDINDSIKKPYNSIMQSLKITIASMKLVVQKLKIALIGTNRLILSIASEIQSGFSWLVSVADICNKALGTPHEKCVDIMKDNLKKYEQYLNHVKGKYHKNSIKDKRNIQSEVISRDLDGKASSIWHNTKTVQDSRKSAEARTKTSNFRETLTDKVNTKHNIDSGKTEDNGDERPWFSYARDVVMIACSPLKRFEKFCVAADFAEETFYATIRSKLKKFVQQLSDLLHVKLNIHHTYTYIGNISSTNQVAAGIITEIRNRADPILTWLSWSSCVTSLFLLLIFFRAKHYQHMFETRSRFDNRFITKEFRKLDLKRLQEGRETVLPLNRRERAKYVTTTSFRLVASEKVHLNRSAVFMTVTTFKLLIHIVADYSLYWVLMTIHHHGKLQSPLQPGITDTGAFVSGSGFVGRLLQSFIETLNAQLVLPTPDQSCLPNPNPPDFKRYCQIGFLIFLLWFFALFEPYGLRLRHLIMGHHRPQRAKTRALWLYNHILRTRGEIVRSGRLDPQGSTVGAKAFNLAPPVEPGGVDASFMKFARRRLHREYKYSSQSSLTFRRWLQVHIPFCWMRSLLGIKPEEPHCLLCNISEDMSNPGTELIRCEVPNCPGTYCTRCYTDIGQLCTICLSPTDYGDISDVSLEKGSDENESDDEDNNFNTSNINKNFDRKIFDDDGSKNDGDDEDDDEDDLRFSSSSNDTLDFNTKSYAGYDMHQTLVENMAILQDVLFVHETNLVNTPFKLFSTEQKTQEYNVVKDVNNNIINLPLTSSTIEVSQYSVYEITNNPFDVKKCESTTQFAKYLRKRKIVRCKKIYVSKNSKYFMTCSDDNLQLFKEEAEDDNGKENRAKDDHNKKMSKDATNPKKGTRKPQNHSRDHQNRKSKQSKQGASKSFKKRIVKGQDKKSKENVHSNSFTLTKYWKNIKYAVSQHKLQSNMKRNLQPTMEKKHKRKKKRKKSDDNDYLLNSRLCAYLEEQDWMEIPRQGCNGKKHLDEETRPKLDVNQTFQVNDVIIPKLNLKLITESQTDHHIVFTRRKDYGKSAINRFFKSIVSRTSIHFNSNKKSCGTSSRPKKLDMAINNLDVSLGGFNYLRNLSSSAPGRRLSKTLSLLKGVYSAMLIHSDASEDTKQIQKPTERQNEQMETKAKKLWKNSFLKRSIKGLSIDKLKKKSKQDEAIDSIPQNVPVKDVAEIPPSSQNTSRKPSDCNFVIEAVMQTPVAKFDKAIQTLSFSNKTEDKAVAVYPMMKSCGFQSRTLANSTNHNAVQVDNGEGTVCRNRIAKKVAVKIIRSKPISQGYEKSTQAVDSTCHKFCNCSLHQYNNPKNRSIGTCLSEGRGSVLRIEEIQTEHSSTESLTSSDNTQSDTTVCRVENIRYKKRMQVGYKVKEYKHVGTNISNTNMNTHKIKHHNANNINRTKLKRPKLVTKANRSTLTDNTRLTDVSTATDWWSPLVEKKNMLKQKVHTIEKKECNSSDEKGIKRGVLIGTGDKVVKFRSSALLIPDIKSRCIIGTDQVDILSPMRYLLESQKYYNELFCGTLQVYPVINVQMRPHLDRDLPQSRSRRQNRRGRKTKRLVESYSPRKEVVRIPESSRKARKRKPRMQK